MRIFNARSLSGAVYRRVVVLIMVIGFCMAAITFAIAKQEVDNASDGQLITAANVLYSLMQDELSEHMSLGNSAGSSMEFGDDLLSKEDAQAFHASADWRMFAVFMNGRAVLRSDTGPPTLALPATPGFHDFTGADHKWRAFGLSVPRHHMVLVVAERVDARDAILRRIAEALIWPTLLLLPATAALLWLSLRSGLAELRRLSAALAERSLQDLEMFDPIEWPTDLEMLIIALNRLFERVAQAFEREQSFTDDAAHQLRTPLAALRLQAQLIARKADGAALQADVAALLAGISRATMLIDQMLTLARLEATALARQPVDLRAEVSQVVADQAPVAALREVEFAVDGAARKIASDATLIRQVLSNLFENAVKNAPAGSLVEITIDDTLADSVLISVADHGAGIPEHERQLVMKRFARGNNAQQGAGLGLAIVARALDILGGRLEFADRDEGDGLIARITIPR